MSRIWIASLTLLFTLTTGCASVKVAKENTLPKPKSGMGVVYFYRESRFMGSFTRHHIWMQNDKPKVVGGLKNGSYFALSLKPGTYRFYMEGEFREDIEVEVKAGQTNYVECQINMGLLSPRPKLTPTTASHALDKIVTGKLVMTENQNSL